VSSCTVLSGPVEPVNFYSCFLEMVRSYLDGNTETTVYEEQLRDIFGIYAYVGFTMDKLIQNIVRQVTSAHDDVFIAVANCYKNALYYIKHEQLRCHWLKFYRGVTVTSSPHQVVPKSSRPQVISASK